MKYILFAFHVIFITAITKGQFKDDVHLLSNIQPNEFPKDSTEVIPENSQPLNINSLSASTNLFKSKENRFITLLAGYASAEGESGIHLEAARIYQPRGFGFGAYMSYVRIFEVNYSNWTITGLQLRAGAAKGEIKPYGVFDFGLLNLTYNDGKVTLGTGTLGLGGGIEKSIGAKSSFLIDFRWKRFFDYRAKRDAFAMWTINAGFKF